MDGVVVAAAAGAGVKFAVILLLRCAEFTSFVLLRMPAFWGSCLWSRVHRVGVHTATAADSYTKEVEMAVAVEASVAGASLATWIRCGPCRIGQSF